MRTLSLTLAALAVVVGVVAPAALAKRKPHCPPGSYAQEYCQIDPGHRGDPGHGHWHRHGRHDDARIQASLGDARA
jgi:hypothetical protein